MDPRRVLTGPLTYRSLTACDLSTCTKKQILDNFENSYSLNESVFTVLTSEKAFYTCPDRLRLPLIFYYSHTAVVYINKLILAGLIKERVNFEFETMFETGVDEMSWDDTENYRMGGSYQWPKLEECVEFRAKVRDIVRRVIKETPLTLPVTQDSPWWAVFMGIDHERIHIETSSVLIRQLPAHMVHRPTGWTIAPKSYGEGVMKNRLVQVKEMEVEVGKPRDFPTYGFDNEYPLVKKKVPAFEASAYMITNKQFLHFVNTGGYENREWWSKEGWDWCEYRKAKHPIFWVCEQGCVSNCGGIISGHSHCKPINNNREQNGNQLNGIHGNGQIIQQNGNGHIEQCAEKYRLRTMCEEIQMPWDWPVVINYHEAKAYCNWLGQGFRILTEAEHHAIRGHEPPSSDGASAEFSLCEKKVKKFNTNMQYGSSTPVNMHLPTDAGFYDVFGNVWEWTEDHFNGLPGFETHAYYDDFSTPTFDGCHNVIVGGSWVSTGSQAARYGRYAFRRHFFQHAGFRIARTLDSSKDAPVALMPDFTSAHQEFTIQLSDVNRHLSPSTNSQLQEETHRNMTRQLKKEYNTPENTYCTNIAATCRQLMQRHGGKFKKAIDFGCGCGATTFDLAQDFEMIIGSDFCGKFIDAAEKLRRHGRLAYHMCGCPCPRTEPLSPKNPRLNADGDLVDVYTATVPCEYDASRVDFKQFTWVPNELLDFDLVIQQSLHRVQNKKAWLLRLHDILVPSGLVIIVCMDEWTEDDIKPIVQDRLKFVESMQMGYIEDAQQKNTLITVWKKC